MVIIVDALEIDLGFKLRPLRNQVARRKMIFAILVTQFVIGVVYVLSFFAFLWRKRLKVVQIVGTFIVRTLENDRIFSGLPFAESVTAMRAEILGLAFASGAMGDAQGIADFASDLRGFFAIVDAKVP